MSNNMQCFVKMHDSKYKKLQQLESKHKEYLAENIEQKKALVKKNIDLA